MQSFNYRLTVADLVDARLCAYNSFLFVRVIKLLAVVVILGSLTVGAYLAYQRDWSGVRDAAPWLIVGIVWIATSTLGNRFFVPLSARKHLAQSKALQDEVTVSWDADRIQLDSDHGQLRFRWDEFYRWQESRLCLLLWSSGRLYHPIPKRVMTEAQISDFRANLTRGLAKPGKARR